MRERGQARDPREERIWRSLGDGGGGTREEASDKRLRAEGAKDSVSAAGGGDWPGYPEEDGRNSR